LHRNGHVQNYLVNGNGVAGLLPWGGGGVAGLLLEGGGVAGPGVLQQWN